MKFSDLSDKDLMMAYKGYKMMEETGAVGCDDFGGIFRKAIDECGAQNPGFGVINATNELLRTLADKWVEEHSIADDVLTVGTQLWYVDESGDIERAVVCTVQYKNGKLDSFSAEFPDSDDFDEFFGSALGSCFFRSETQARLHIGPRE